ncbi:hypothetical protein KIL84_007510 [Mauremys mutica]|uniref:Uncharacterized protein n=1 Tax=Mauremys mutica TaxID=74926 RepID=A0A9D3X1F9_9SAUR|nr:hypothetical protein KIL84_007510 [Mauremys mutica]
MPRPLAPAASDTNLPLPRSGKQSPGVRKRIPIKERIPAGRSLDDPKGTEGAGLRWPFPADAEGTRPRILRDRICTGHSWGDPKRTFPRIPREQQQICVGRFGDPGGRTRQHSWHTCPMIVGDAY